MKKNVIDVIPKTAGEPIPAPMFVESLPQRRGKEPFLQDSSSPSWSCRYFIRKGLPGASLLRNEFIPQCGNDALSGR